MTKYIINVKAGEAGRLKYDAQMIIIKYGLFKKYYGLMFTGTDDRVVGIKNTEGESRYDINWMPDIISNHRKEPITLNW